MGMFDLIHYSMPCPVCDTILADGWQSKDAQCDLDLLEPGAVRSFYNICPVCEVWIKMVVVPKQVEIRLEIRLEQVRPCGTAFTPEKPSIEDLRTAWQAKKLTFPSVL